jgi:hypothetical protein
MTYYIAKMGEEMGIINLAESPIQKSCIDETRVPDRFGVIRGYACNLKTPPFARIRVDA